MMVIIITVIIITLIIIYQSIILYTTLFTPIRRVTKTKHACIYPYMGYIHILSSHLTPRPLEEHRRAPHLTQRIR